MMHHIMSAGEPLSMSPAEIRRRLSYLEITAEDEQRLRDVHPHLQRHAGRIIDQFYEYLLSHEHTRALLSAPGLIVHLKSVQLKYFSELTAGEYGAAYFENRLKVGAAHNRVGLAPEWYLGAYTKYLHIVADVLRETFRDDPLRFFQTMVSLTKVINLDMGLAIDAYIHAAQQTLEAANAQLRKVEAARQQLTDMIVHDLQNPLAGIAAFLKVLEPSPHLSASVREALQEALRRCHD